ncbi:MAG: signal peptidase I [Bacillota bacterium]|nr:signal peptidase I [Bacillota bacterium]
MKFKNILKDYIIPIVLAMILAFVVRKYIIFQIEVPSESMYPTIKIGDRIMVTRLYDLSKLKRGDLVVFDSEEIGKPLIKRLIGLPGDKVVVDKGTVSVNGEKIKEDYVVNNEDYSGNFEVPEGKYLFFGDNRSNSFDSRKWQNPYIDASDIRGKARFIIYPFKRFGKFVSGEDALTH